jgi:hypothetical protein
MFVLHALLQRCNAGKCSKRTRINGLSPILQKHVKKMEKSSGKNRVTPLGARSRVKFLFVCLLKILTGHVCCASIKKRSNFMLVGDVTS